MTVHAIQTGRMVGNEAFLRGKGWSALFRRRKDFEFPAYVYILERADGLLAIDAGPSSRGWPVPGPIRRMIPRPVVAPDDEVGPQMESRGLDPAEVRTVVLTHLDPDHVGGIGHFRDAEHLVHRREHEFATSMKARFRSRPQDWPSWFDPTLYDLEDQPLGPFAKSTALESGDLRVVPLPGHTPGQVGIVAERNGTTLFFAADHMLNQDWFTEDRRAGRVTNVGLEEPKLYRETNDRVHEFVEDRRVVVLPAHDPKAPDRLDKMQPVPGDAQMSRS